MQRVLFAIVGMAVILTGCVTTVKTADLTEAEQTYFTKVQAFPTVFVVPKDEAETAWARGIRFINDHSGMKIQTTTDYSVSTYSPRGHGALYYGYSISRVPEGDVVTFQVDCLRDTANFASKEIALNNAKLLAYYMKTGELQPKFIGVKVDQE